MSPAVMLKLVEDKPGIKATELFVEYITNIREAGLEPEPTEQLIDMVNTLVESGDLVEVEYILPTMDYRIKSLYFPKGTKASVVVPKVEQVEPDRKIVDDNELFTFIKMIVDSNIVPITKPNAGAENGKELIRVKSAARKITDYLNHRLKKE